jgi:predicted AlkP superfamily pyrophosphatase or phosphodiesterase
VRSRGGLLGSVLAFVLLLSGAAAAAPPEPPVVIVLSWDGTRYDYPERAQTLALARMQRDGARADRLTPVFPSSTFPNHVSLATGTYVDRHGIIGNRFKDDAGRVFDYSNDASWIAAEPLWIAAERQGVRSATYFWVGSETDWHGHGASYRKVPFDASIGEAEKVDQILAWLALPPDQRPRLIMSWWHGCDHVGHEEGPDSPNIVKALLAQDAQLERLFEALDARAAWDHTTVIVVSDHGMASVDSAIDSEALLEAAGIHANVQNGGGDAQVYLADPKQRDAALAVLAKVEGLKAYTPENLPARFRSYFPKYSGDLTLVATPPSVLARPNLGQRATALLNRVRGLGSGSHGYDPEIAEMGAIFFALGRGVPPGTKLEHARTIDVAPTAAALLGIDPPLQSEGHSLFALPLASD